MCVFTIKEDKIVSMFFKFGNVCLKHNDIIYVRSCRSHLVMQLPLHRDKDLPNVVQYILILLNFKSRKQKFFKLAQRATHFYTGGILLFVLLLTKLSTIVVVVYNDNYVAMQSSCKNVNNYKMHDLQKSSFT